MDLIHVLGGGLEPPRLTAYAPQTYVSAISPPERCGGTELVSRTIFLASVSSGELGARSEELQEFRSVGAPNGQAREDLRRNSPLGGPRCFREGLMVFGR